MTHTNGNGLAAVNNQPAESTNTHYARDFIAPSADCATDQLIQWTELPDKSGATMTAHSGTWPALLERLRTVGTFPSKEKCPWLKVATFGTQRAPGSGSLRTNENLTTVYGIEADYDGELVTMAQASRLLESYGIRAALYPSPSNTTQKPRWRVIAPLARQHTPAERAGLVARLNGALGGILAGESFVLSQGYFFGATPTNEYQVIEVDGQCIDTVPEWMLPTPIGKNNSSPKERKTCTSSNARHPSVTLEVAQEMLDYLDPDCGREDWRNVGMGLKHQFGDEGFDLWDEWSKGSNKYNEKTIRGQWDSFRNDHVGGVTIGSVMHMAIERGWPGLVPDAQGHFGAVDFSPLVKTTIDNATGEIVYVKSPKNQPQLVSLTDLDSFVPDPPMFWVDELLPADVVTLLGAHGGTGKTTLALHAAVCFAMGLPFLGKQTKPAKVLFFSAEDDSKIMRWKLHNECQRLNVDPAALSHQLTVIDASEADSVLYVEARREGVTKGVPTAVFQDLVNTVAHHGSQIVIMDNASDLYGGNENDRGQVRGFIRLLAQLVRPMHGAVLLLAHVDKLTARSGGTQGYSGSTAWHNSVRSRLFLSADEKTGDLVLEHQKSNRGKKAEPIRLVFEGSMIILAQSPSGADACKTPDAIAPILTLLEEFFQRGEFVSTSPTAHTNAFKVLANEPSFPKRLTKQDLWQLLRNAERQKLIYRETYKNSQRKESERWRVGAPSLRLHI